jgi:hypothetical protein
MSWYVSVYPSMRFDLNLTTIFPPKIGSGDHLDLHILKILCYGKWQDHDMVGEKGVYANRPGLYTNSIFQVVRIPVKNPKYAHVLVYAKTNSITPGSSQYGI